MTKKPTYPFRADADVDPLLEEAVKKTGFSKNMIINITLFNFLGQVIEKLGGIRGKK